MFFIVSLTVICKMPLKVFLYRRKMAFNLELVEQVPAPFRGFPGGSVVKNLLPLEELQEMWV